MPLASFSARIDERGSRRSRRFANPANARGHNPRARADIDRTAPTGIIRILLLRPDAAICLTRTRPSLEGALSMMVSSELNGKRWPTSCLCCAHRVGEGSVKKLTHEIDGTCESEFERLHRELGFTAKSARWACLQIRARVGETQGLEEILIQVRARPAKLTPVACR